MPLTPETVPQSLLLQHALKLVSESFHLRPRCFSSCCLWLELGAGMFVCDPSRVVSWFSITLSSPWSLISKSQISWGFIFPVISGFGKCDQENWGTGGKARPYSLKGLYTCSRPSTRSRWLGAEHVPGTPCFSMRSFMVVIYFMLCGCHTLGVSSD